MFSCPCGKKYLSYPALFTHVKRKHDGHAPGSIEVPRTKTVTRRGRPAVELRPAFNINNTIQLQCLEMIELTILKICECCQQKNQSPILMKNQEPNAPPKSCHPLFHQTSHRSLFKESIFTFSQELCQHFTQQMRSKIYELLSLFLWWLETEKLSQNIENSDSFIRQGLESQCKLRKIAMHDQFLLKIDKLILIGLSKWLYFKGISKSVLEQIVQ